MKEFELLSFDEDDKIDDINEPSVEVDHIFIRFK